MKRLVSIPPIFDPTNKTLDFSAYPSFELKRLYAVINVTRNTPIYIPGAAGYAISSAVINTANPNIVTLSFDTTSHAANDILNVYYEYDMDINDPLLVQLEKIHQVNHFMLMEMRLQTQIMIEGFNGRIITDDAEALRNDMWSQNDSDFE